MRWPDVGLLSLLLSIGGYCAWNDLTRNIVPNRGVVIALVGGALLHAVRLLAFGAQNEVIWLLNLLIGSALAVLMYAGGIWAAGDVKLFAALFACVPGVLLEDNMSQSMPVYLLIFFIAFVYLVIDTAKKALARTEAFRTEHIAWSQIVDLILLSIEITALQVLGNLIAPTFCAENPLLISALALIAAYLYSEKGLVRAIPFLLLNGVFLLGVLLAGIWSLSAPDVRIYLVVAVMILFRRKAAQYNYQRLPTGEVKAGMILSSATVMQFAVSRVQGLPKDVSESMSARLSAAEAEAVRRWETSAHGAAQVVIVRKIPFAGFIYLGFFLWMLIKVVQIYTCVFTC